MATRFKSDGTVYALDAQGSSYRLARGTYLLDDSGQLSRYSDGRGMAGFWESIGNGFKSVGSWIGNHFGQIAATGIGIYAVHQNLNLGQQSLAQQQAQAAANAAAQQQAQAQEVGGVGGGLDLGTLLPIAAVGVGVYLLASRR